MNLIGWLGWFGAISLLLAYFLLVHKNLTSRSKAYQWMNIVGALLLAVNTYNVQAYPSFAINLAWVFIGLYGIFHIVRYSKKTAKK